MPALNQPPLLQTMTMAVWLKFFSAYCRRYAHRGDLDKLRSFVDYIKNDLDPCIPRQFSAKICNLLIDCCAWPPQRDALKIVMQLAMDLKIVGFRCRSSMLDLLNSDELSRIQGVQELFLNTDMNTVAGLRLGDLKKLTYPKICTDSDLEEIGRNCPGLEYLDITGSKKVTDVGLRALSPCKNLSTVVASFCSAISLKGINDLLSANSKIRKLSAWAKTDIEGFDCFSVEDSTVYPSIESFTLLPSDIAPDVRNDRLRLIADKFPNLKTIKIPFYFAEDLSLLESLSQLSQIELGRDMPGIWDVLEPRLRQIGAKITKLRISLSDDFSVLQSQLNSIFELCNNIEYLDIMCEVRDNQEILLIPPFQKLKNLRFCNYGESDIAARFDQMLELEILELLKGLAVTTAMVESLAFDHTNFPKLKIMILRELPHDVCRDVQRIQNTTKRRNLNLQIHYSRTAGPAPPYRCYRPDY